MRWPASRLTELLGIRFPIVQAPMAGGPSTVELAVAVSEAGGLGSIAGAMMSPDELRAAIRAVRERSTRPFAVNVFAPLPPVEPDSEVVQAVQRELAPHRERLGLPEPETSPPPGWTVSDQLAVVAEERVPALSFTFGIPQLDGLGDVVLMGTATTAEEAAGLERAGVHVVVAQGAGGGRAPWDVHRHVRGGARRLAALVPQVVHAVSVPVVASGGIVDGGGIAAALALGAEGVQLGTAFIPCPESGASPQLYGGTRCGSFQHW